MLQKGKGTIFTKSKVAPAPVQESSSQSSSSKLNTFERKLRETKVKLRKVPEPIPKRSPIIPSSSSECPICLESMNKPNQLTTTRCCKKKFHKNCIDKCNTSVCPLCRHNNLIDDIFDKLTETEKKYPNVKKLIENVATHFADNFQDRYDYEFINSVISNNRIKIILRSVKRYIKTAENIDTIIEREILNV